MGYHPFELIKLTSTHTRTTVGRPESILAPMDNKCHPFRFRSQHIPLSRSLALQGFFPQQIVILSLQRVAITQPPFTSPQAITIVSFQPSHHMVGHYNRYIQKTFQFFSPFLSFYSGKYKKKCYLFR